MSRALQANSVWDAPGADAVAGLVAPEHGTGARVERDDAVSIDVFFRPVLGEDIRCRVARGHAARARERIATAEAMERLRGPAEVEDAWA